MKQFLTGSILLIIALGAQAQTLETGLSVNANHLWQSHESLHLDSRTDGYGLSVMARYQNPNTTYLLLKNNELGLEFSQGQIEIQNWGGVSSRGITTSINYKSSSVTLNNYFVNFGSLEKGFQAALGLHCNYKIFTLSEGFTEELFMRVTPISQDIGFGSRKIRLMAETIS